MRFIIFLISMIFLAGSLPAAAAFALDDMPPPKRAPRTPVASQKLESGKKAPKIAVGDEISGDAVVLDGEHLQVRGQEMRLFGVVPPQLSAPLGPQARQRLDKLVAGAEVTCEVRDRARDGRLLALCGTEKTPDLGLAMLRDGYAVVARGSVDGADIAAAYEMAEEKAQSKKLGLWHADIEEAAAETPPPASAAIEAPAPVQAPALPEQAKSADGNWLLPVWLLLLYIVVNTLWQSIARSESERRERRALAAALRGELAAARGICMTKAEQLTHDMKADGKGIGQWPRLRTIVFQAHVSKIGLLGASLGRKVASLYGQFADYAAYVGAQAIEGAHSKADTASVRNALLTLVAYIDMTAEELEAVERANTGFLSRRPKAVPVPASAAPAAPEEEAGEADEIVTVGDESDDMLDASADDTGEDAESGNKESAA
ncbi:MAG: hypothetical protein GC131_08715 [Alphaproteobacteria bacterium]|nr:hypothetical protein [Alphaproteobacteria bacterium]